MAAGVQEGGAAAWITTREMRAHDIGSGVRLCRSSGWNQVESDWSLLLALSPHGCVVAETNGDVVGTVVTFSYENRFSWVAMMLVDPQHRRERIGTRLFSEALHLLGDQSCIRLDATPAGRELYRLHGFADEYPISRFVRNVTHIRAVGSGKVRPMRQQDLPEIFVYDREVFGADRRAVLSSLLVRSAAYAWVFDGQGIAGLNIQGYCFGRPGFRYHQIGPVVARNETVAQELVSECLDYNRGLCFGIDAPRHCQPWLDWLASNGFVEERSFVRMRRGENRYAGDVSSMFAICGPEFG